MLWTWLACTVEQGTLSLDATSLYVGTVELGEQATASVELSHAGDTSVTLRADVDAPFGLGELPAVLRPGDSVAVEVVLVGAIPGAHEGSLAIQHDGAGDTLNVDLAGEVLAPEPSVEPSHLDLVAHAEAAGSFALHNEGTGTLHATLELEGDERMELSDDTLEVGAGESAAVTVWAPDAPGARARVLVATDHAWLDLLEVTIDVDRVGIELLEPSDGEAYQLADTPTLSAAVTADEPLESVSVTWTSSEDGELGTAWADADGLAELSVGTPLSEGWHQLTAVAASSAGSASAEVLVEVACGTEDTDGDGLSECDGDCWPHDVELGPHGEEVCEDGLDQDCDGADISCRTTFSGIQTDLVIDDLVGWEVCYTDTYADEGTGLAAIRAACDKAYVMYACGPSDADAYTAAAYAERAIVFTDNGEANAGTDGNGASWYLGADESMGFFEPGDGVVRNSCDTETGAFPQHRLCWHTSDGQLDTGWRCGETRSISDESWIRVVLHGD